MDQLQYVNALNAMYQANQLTHSWPKDNVITSDILDELADGHRIEGAILQELGWVMNNFSEQTNFQARHDDFVKSSGVIPFLGNISW